MTNVHSLSCGDAATHKVPRERTKFESQSLPTGVDGIQFKYSVHLADKLHTVRVGTYYVPKPGKVSSMMSLLEARRLVVRCVEEFAMPSALREQAADFFAETTDEFGSIRIRPRSNSRADGLSGPLVDGETQDADSGEIFAILFITNGALSGLQIYRGDGLALLSEPHASSFGLFAGMTLVHLASSDEVPLDPPAPLSGFGAQ